MGKESIQESTNYLNSKKAFLNHNGSLRYGIIDNIAVLVSHSLNYSLVYNGHLEVEALTSKDYDEAANVSATINFESKHLNPNNKPLSHFIEIEKRKVISHTKGDNLYFVGKVDNKIIGVIRFLDIDGKNGKFGVGILKEYAGKAYGKKLIHALISKLRQKNYETLTLDVNKENIVAFGLYKKLRFKVVSEDKTEYEMKFYFNE